MTDVTQWSQTDASNNAASPSGWPEGMAPSGVNNSARADKGGIARMWAWLTPKQTGGTTSAFTLTYDVAPSALANGMVHVVDFHAAPAVTATLNVGVGARPLHYRSAAAWRRIPADLWAADHVAAVAYHSATDSYRLIDMPDRTGIMSDFAGVSAPAGALFCAGQAISRAEFPGLFVAVGTAYGAGDGSTTFNVPDARDRVSIARGDMGGSAANRITSGVAGFVSTTLGATGGAQSATVSATATGTIAGTLNVTGAITGATAANIQGGGALTVAQLTDTVSASTTSFAGITTTAAARTSATVIQPSIVVNKVIWV